MPRLPGLAIGLIAVLIAGLLSAPSNAGPRDAASAPDSRAPATRPNIVVVMADDMRVDEMLFAPSIRKLVAEQGLEFRNSFSPYPLCCPARASFLTGQYAHNHGITWHLRPKGFGAFDDSRTIATSLSAAGYQTGFIGKYLNGYGRMRSKVTKKPSLRYVPAGWDEWYGALDAPAGGPIRGNTYDYFNTPFNINGRVRDNFQGQYQTDVIGRFSTRMATRFAKSSKPFFMYVNYVAPHFGGPFEPGDVRQYKMPTGGYADYRSPARPRWVKGRFDKVIKRGAGVPKRGRPLEADVRDKPKTFRKLSEPGKRERRLLRDLTRQRAEAVFVMDRQVRRLIRTLKRSGAWSNTVFVFTSDNGYFLGEHRKRSGKIYPHEPSLRVPLVLTGPGLRQGEQRDDPVTTLDLAATVLDLAEATPPMRGDGRSMVATMLLGDRGWRTPVVTEAARPTRGRTFSADRTSVGLRTARYSLIRNARGRHELYDLLRDPLQDRNVYRSRKYRVVRKQLLRALASSKDCAGASCARPLPPGLRYSAQELTAATDAYWDAIERTYGF